MILSKGPHFCVTFRYFLMLFRAYASQTGDYQITFEFYCFSWFYLIPQEFRLHFSRFTIFTFIRFLHFSIFYGHYLNREYPRSILAQNTFKVNKNRMQKRKASLLLQQGFKARRKGLEPPTYWFVARHSIQLS